MKGLTKRQREILDFIQHYIEEHHYSPSYREIQEHFGYASLGSVYKHLKVLQRKGVVEAEKHMARSVAISQGKSPFGMQKSVELPFLGIIAAGRPIQTFAQAGTMVVPASLARDPQQSYVLQVQGQSMVGHQIGDGDLIVIERSTPQPGAIVVALIRGEEATLKSYHPQGGVIELRPANSDYESLMIPEEELEIQGVLRGLVRRYS